MKTKVRRVNVRNFRKNEQEKQVLFQRFVTSIVVSNFGNYSACLLFITACLDLHPQED